MVALDVLDGRVHGKPSRKGDGEVVSEGADFAALVFEVVDKLGVFAVFTSEDFF